MANLQANLRSQSVNARENPEPFLASVNRSLFANTTPNAYATLFFSDFDHRSAACATPTVGNCRLLSYARMVRLRRLEATSTVVGLFREWEVLHV